MILNLILQQSMDLPTPFEQDFDVNAIDMLGLKAQAIQEGCNMLLGYFRVKAQPRFLSEGRRCSVGLVFYIGGSSFLIFLEWQKATAVV